MAETMNKQLTCGSLFAGIGGFDLGFERAEIKTVWQVEIDEYCRRVLARHWPNAERFHDVRECGRDNLSAVDVICGGFPCQDISQAGQRAGIDGERSGLWREYHRIIGELRPRFVVVENVSALLFRGMGRVLGDLAAIGYDAEWDCIPACALGAPHIRERIWIVAYPDTYKIGRILGWPSIDSSGDERGQQPRGFAAELAEIAWSRNAEPAMAGVADGIPEYVDAYGALGNAVVPQIAEWIGRRIVEAAMPGLTREALCDAQMAVKFSEKESAAQSKKEIL